MPAVQQGPAPFPAHAAGVWRVAEKAAQVSLSEWFRDAPQRNVRIVKSVTPSGDSLLDQKAWEKRESEISTGAVQGPFSVSDVDLSAIAVHPSFPVWERGSQGQWKARNIENLNSSGANATVHTHEPYAPDDLDTARAAVRFCKELWGGDEPLAGFSSGYSGAFRQSPLSPAQIPYMWSAVWHPGRGEPVLLRNLGQVLGGAGTQFNYVRDPSAMCSVMRHFSTSQCIIIVTTLGQSSARRQHRVRGSAGCG